MKIDVPDSSFLQRIADNVPHFLWTAQPEGHALWCNRFFCDYVGLPLESLLGNGWQVMMHPDDIAHARQVWREADETQLPYSLEARFRRHDGSYRRHFLQMEPQRADNGEWLFWLGTATDIERLRSVENELQTIVANSPDVVWRVDRQLRHSFISPNIERVTGRAASEWIGRTGREMGLPAASCDRFETLCREVFCSERETKMEFENGGRFFRSRLIPEKGDSGAVETILGITEDVTEARNSAAEVERGRRRTERITAAMPGMLYVYDLKQARHLFINDAVQGILGYTPAQVSAWSQEEADSLIHPDDVERQKQVVARYATLSDGEVLESEHRMRHADGSYRWMRAREVVFSRDKTGRVTQILGVALDISQRKAAEAAVIENEERWRVALDAAHLGSFDWDVEARQGWWNAWHFRVLGLEPSDGPQQLETVAARLHPDDVARLGEKVRRAIEQRENFEIESRVLNGEAETRWIAAAGGVTAQNENGQATRISGVIWDISARKAIEEELRRVHDELENRVAQRTRELAVTIEQLRCEVEQRQRAEATRSHLLTRLVSAQEEERRRISRELHDQMGQTLTAMLMSIDALALEAAPALSPDLQTRCRRVRDLTAALMQQTHDLAWELRPAALDNLGLIVALRQSLTEWSARTGVAGDFVTRGLGEERLSPHLETVLYRVAQESLHNIARHAQARTVSIVLEAADREVVLIVEDDGRGFNPSEAEEGRLGLVGMSERMDAVGGTLQIESARGEGTAIFARATRERRREPR